MVKTYLFIINPNSRESNVGVTLYYENGEKRTFNVNVPAYKHRSIDLKEKTMPEKRFGIKVTGTAPIVAATANYNKKFSSGSGGTGTTLLAKNWYFPDGYTSIDASEFINIVNPSFGAAHIKFTLYYEDGTTTVFDDTVPANSKKMFLLNNYASDMKRFSTAVESDVSVAAENTHYDDSYSAGHGSVGATAAATDSYFAYSISNDDVFSQLAVFNPSPKESSLDITFYYADGMVRQLKESVPAMMRSTIDLGKLALPDKPFGLYVSSSEPTFIKQVLYDKKHSAGYAYMGMSTIPDVEEPEIEKVEKTPQETELKYTLLGQEAVPSSKLGETIKKGLTSATKYTYSYGSSNLLAWHFSYKDERSASGALRSALAGDLFSILEVTPANIRGLSTHYFVTHKSEGYMWLNAKDIYIFVGPVQESSSTMGLAELFVAGTPPQAEHKTGLWTIIMLLAALILLILITRRVFRKNSEGEEAAWAGIIPSAKPKHKHMKKDAKTEHAAQNPGQKRADVRQQKQHSSAHPTAVKKEQHGDKKKEASATKHQKSGPKEQKENKYQKREQDSHKERPAAKPREPVKDISIKEIPRDKLTAQDLLDHMEEIPDYEDVFRHVNRDQEEIKPK
jgi:hypothetical protein